MIGALVLVLALGWVSPAEPPPQVAPQPGPPPAAEAYLVLDLDTGDILAAHNARKRMRPASTQKMLTALTLLPKLGRESVYLATKADAWAEGTAIGLRPGYRYSIDQLFHGMLVKSANDAANALARANGGLEGTVAQMNAMAKRIGARDTHADNPNGLDPDDRSPQYTTAYDLALIARMGMRYEDFRRYICTKTYPFPVGKGATYVLGNTNRLLGKYPGMFGVKTGYTTKAGNTIVVAAKRNGHRVLVSAMRINSPTYPTVAALLDWGFGAIDRVRPLGQMPLPVDEATARRATIRAYVL